MKHSRARWTSGAAMIGAGALIAAGLAHTPATAEPEAARPAAPEGSARGAMQHLEAFQRIATRFDDRASGKEGYDASVRYVTRRLERAGYEPTVQAFDFPFFEQTGPSTFERTAPTATTYTEDEDYALMTYSGSGEATAPVQAVDLAPVDNPGSSTSGCETADFAGFTPGNIALMQRGACPFGQKVANAQTAGAVGAIIFNTGTAGNTDAFAGTLGAPQEGEGIPAIGTSYAIGQDLAAEGTEVHLATSTESDIRETYNVLAETKGRKSNVVMAGAHLDSVGGGPGINDNGSGSGALLEAAEAMAERKGRPDNRVRFAWWGAEELGLLGSEHYVADLAENHPGRLQNIALYLNFDMVASPNYILGVYDGNGDTFSPPESTDAPTGSAAIERTFHRYFAKIGTGSVDTAFSGRSDYGPFILENVPAGGLFTGAEGVKNGNEARMFGGRAGVAYDECYHQACDDMGNVSRKALRANTGAIWRAVLKYSRSTESVNGDSTGHQPPAEDTAARRSIARSDALHGQEGAHHRRDYHAESALR
jgi:Zn-dependent M28 family amino/carboxypeptidase